MARPRTPELDVIEDQATLLRQILGGENWYTEIGDDVRYEALPEEDPPLHVALSGVRSEPGSTRTAVRVTVDWRAVVPLEIDDARAALYVLADLRSALLCGAGDYQHQVEDTRTTWREVGSNYAVITLSASTVRAA